MTDVGLGVGRGGRGDERGGGVGKGGGRGVVGKGKGGGIAGISIKTLAITSCFFFLKRRAFCHYRLSLNLAGFSLDRGRFERAKRFRRGWLKGEGVGKRRGERERREGQERREEE